MTQAEMILADLLKGKRITPLDALRDYSCFRLGARIFDLKQDGHDIRTEIVETAGGAHVAEYWLATKPRFPVEPDGQLTLLEEVRA